MVWNSGMKCNVTKSQQIFSWKILAFKLRLSGQIRPRWNLIQKKHVTTESFDELDLHI